MVKGKTSAEKKKWYEILAPRMFDERIIGETTASEPGKLIGKPVLLNLMVLTNDPRKQNINVKFVIDDVKEDKAITKVIGYYLSSSHLRRLMRRATTRVDDSVLVETSDNVRVRIKPFILTRQYVRGSVSTSMRNSMRNFILKQVRKNTYEKLVNGIVTTKFQRALSTYLKRIYPLRACEIKSMQMEKEKKIVEKPKVKEEKAKVEAVKKEKPKEKKEVEPKEEVKEKREEKTKEKKEMKPEEKALEKGAVEEKKKESNNK